MNSNKACAKYNIEFCGFTPEYNQKLGFNNAFIEAIKPLPKDSSFVLKLKKKRTKYVAILQVKSLEFGCKIQAKGDNFDACYDLLFESLGRQIEKFELKREKVNFIDHYLGGYPSFYTERKIA